MTAAWILVILLGSFICTRIFRSTRMWWIYISFILAGLLVGMLSKEVSKSNKKDLTSYTQLISNSIRDNSMDCTQFVATVTEGPTIGHPEIVSYNSHYSLFNRELTNKHTTRGRDSPNIEDSS